MNQNPSMNVESAQDFFTTGNQLFEAGRLSDAIIQYQKALEVESDNYEGWDRLSEAYYRLGQLEAALSSCQQLIKLKPNFAEAYKTLGNILQSQGKVDAAVRAYTAAIQIQPNFAEAYANLGTMFYKQNRLEEAIKCYQKSVEINPKLAGVYWNLGSIFQQLDRQPEMNFYKEKALRLNPELGGAEFLLKLGNSLSHEEEFDQAIDYYRRALKLKVDYAEAYSALGLKLLQKEEQKTQENLKVWKEGWECLLTALKFQPNLMVAHQGLYKALVFSSVEKDLEIIQEIASQYIKISQKPEQVIAKIADILIHLKVGLTETAKAKFLDVESTLTPEENQLTLENFANVYTGLVECAFYLRDDFEANTHLVKKIAQTYQKLLTQYLYSPIQEDWMIGSRQDNLSKPLKIGFLSQTFTGERFEVITEIIQTFSFLNSQLFLYETNPEKNDRKSTHFETLAHKFYRLERKSFISSVTDDEEILEQVSKDNLDILIDLDSQLIPLHINVLAYQPASICLSWGRFEPPFIQNQNYFLCDGYTHPVGQEQYYTENLVRLPHAWIAVSGFKNIQADRDAIRRVYRLDSHQIVYLCTAPACQLNSDLIAAQMQILKQVPESVLIYQGLGNLDVIHSMYQKACQAQEIGFYRIKLIEKNLDDETIQLYKAADIWLDSYPYNDGIQALKALWFELPVVTRMGESGVSRSSYSLLKNLHLEAGIAESWDEYVQWGIQLGKEDNLRKSIKQQLNQSKQLENLSPVWNPKQFAQDMYTLLQGLLNTQTT